jgi:hypothetical protein
MFVGNLQLFVHVLKHAFTYKTYFTMLEGEDRSNSVVPSEYSIA